MRKFLSIVAFSLLLFTACSGVDSAVVENSGSIFSLDELDHDWGDISIDGGEVEHGFHFKNESDQELFLYGVVTSCMCTTAYIELPDGSISPVFGMHENQDWSYAVKPGEMFELEVKFDPMAHGPDAVGPVRRGVWLASSDPSGNIELSVAANVIYEEDYQEQYGESDFVFEETEFDFGVVKQSSGINAHEFSFTYLGEEPISVLGVPTSCACTSAEISKEYFEKGDVGVLRVYFDPNLHEEPQGKFFKTVSLLTDLVLEKQPEVKIWAEMDLDLGPDAYKLKQHVD